MTTIATLLDPFLSLLYPPRCLLCRTLGEASGLCRDCAAQIAPVPSPWCRRCGQSIGDAETCFHCHLRLPAFACARAMGQYDGVLRALIHRFKYRDRPQLAEPLGILLADFARIQSSSLHDLCFDALLPVPMHPVRQRLRGYNQSDRLARVVARELGLPLETQMLTRPRATRPQVGLTGDARRINLRAAFAVPHPELVSGKTLLIVDDVTTTGSTLDACAATLQAAGATAVYALALAAG